MSQNGADLTYKQRKAIAALLEYPTQGEAARAAGVARKTIGRWQQQESFRLALSAAEAQLLRESARRLVLLAIPAVEVLADVLNRPTQKGASTRRLAAQAILDYLLKLRELRALEERLAAVERAVFGG